MKTNRVNKRKIVLSVLLAGTMLSSAVTISNAATYFPSYDFYMPGGGGADRSSDQTKEESGPAYVKLGSVSTSASPRLKLTMRIRKSSNDGLATPPKDFTKDERGARYLYYNSGYGGTGERYYLKMQTHKDAGQGAWVSGTWHP